MGLDPQIALAKGDEHCKVRDPMQRQIVKLQPEEAEEPPHEGMHWDSDPARWKGTKETTCDSFGMGSVASRPNRSQPS